MRLLLQQDSIDTTFHTFAVVVVTKINRCSVYYRFASHCVINTIERVNSKTGAQQIWDEEEMVASKKYEDLLVNIVEYECAKWCLIKMC